MKSLIIQGTYDVPADKLSIVKKVLESLAHPLFTSQLEKNETVLHLKLETNTVEEMASTLKQLGPHIEEVSKNAKTTKVVCVGEVPQVLKSFFNRFNTEYLTQKQFKEMYG